MVLLTKLLTNVIANQSIFCNTPWYEIHIYWDGSYGICCQEAHKLYPLHQQQYNIKTMTIREWFDSEPVRIFRTKTLENNRLSECQRCYDEEDNQGNSRRLKSNMKSVIFTRTAFDQSFLQSPGYRHFLDSHENQGQSLNTSPIDIHVDLGNFCNLACKMCHAPASSKIAAQDVKWGIETSRQYLGTDWTQDQSAWDGFKQQLLEINGLNNIHFMGGETLLTSKFEDLVDTMISHGRFDICFSFVTNGTVFRKDLLDKLKLFRRVGIEISIETTDLHNEYQRQGTDTIQVLNNIDQYKQICNGSSITIALRPAISALTIGYYPTLLQYALDNKVIVKSNLVINPSFLNVKNLPDSVKQLYKSRYLDLLSSLKDFDTTSDYNASDPNNYQSVIKEQILMCIMLLETPAPADIDTKQLQLVRHCEKWDIVYKLDAMQYYPELEDMLKKYEYNIAQS